MEPQNRNIIEINSASFAPDGKKFVFRDVNFTIAPGDVVALLGSNGSGKSSLLKMITGQIDPTLGSVSCNTHANHVVYLPQNYRAGLFPWLTVKEHVKLWSKSIKNFSLESFKRFTDLLTISNLYQRRVGKLSGGEQQLTFLCLCIASNPKLALLDEPLSAVDLARRSQALDFLKTVLKEERISCFMVTHDLDDAANLTSRALVLSATNTQDHRTIDREFGTDYLEVLKGVMGR